MPLLDVKLSGAPDAALAANVAATLSDLTARILRKDPRVTAGGGPLAPPGAHPPHACVRTTAP